MLLNGGLLVEILVKMAAGPVEVIVLEQVKAQAMGVKVVKQKTVQIIWEIATAP